MRRTVVLRAAVAVLLVGLGAFVLIQLVEPYGLLGALHHRDGGGERTGNAARRPFSWRGGDMADNKSFDADATEARDTGVGGAPRRPCRNTVQGARLVTDERGYTCRREDVTEGGCCTSIRHQQANQTETTTTTMRYSCMGCLEESLCCTTFEYCVSCCLRPEEMARLKQSVTAEAQSLLFSLVEDSFELCLAKCRTSSGSVLHENIYRHGRYKYCARLHTPTEGELAAVAAAKDKMAHEGAASNQRPVR